MLTLVCIIAVSAVATAQTATNATTTTATVTESSPAAGTSTVVPAATGSAKNWNLFLISDTSVDQTDVDAVQSTTSVGGSYLLGSTKLGISQAFDSASKEAYFFATSELEQNNFRPMYVEPIASQTVKNFLGSDQTTFTGKVRFYNDNSILYSAVLKKSIDRHYNLSASSAFMLTPSLAFTMHNEARIYQFKDDVPATIRFSAIPGVSYSFADNFSVYQLAGLMVNTKDGEAFRRSLERAYIETGLEYSPKAINGLSVNLLVFQDKMVSSSDGNNISNFSLYSANDSNGFILGSDIVVYEAIVKYTY